MENNKELLNAYFSAQEFQEYTDKLQYSEEKT